MTVLYCGWTVPYRWKEPLAHWRKITHSASFWPEGKTKQKRSFCCSALPLIFKSFTTDWIPDVLISLCLKKYSLKPKNKWISQWKKRAFFIPSLCCCEKAKKLSTFLTVPKCSGLPLVILPTCDSPFLYISMIFVLPACLFLFLIPTAVSGGRKRQSRRFLVHWTHPSKDFFDLPQKRNNRNF